MKFAFLRSATALVFGASLALSAHAADTWTYTGVNASGGGVATASSGATTLTTTGAFVTNNGINGVSGGTGVSGNWSTNTSGSPSAALQFYSGGGLGMGSDGTGTPNHAIDNNGTYTEAVLLSFSTSVMLTGIDIGYLSGDADISVFRYTGSVAPTVNGLGGSLSAMKAAGWQLVGNYADLTADNSKPYDYNLINGATNAQSPVASSASVGSSWWLISAYNSAWGSGTGLTQGDDYFKLLSVAGTSCGTGNTNPCGPTNKTPEPASLALASVALIGVLGVSRRKGKKTAA